MSFPEQDRAVQILEKEFGPRWKQIVQELGTKELRQRVGMRVGQMEAFIVKGQYNCVSDTRSYKKPFIPVVTEYLLLFHKQDALFFPFAVRRETTVDLRKEDIPGLTWHHLIRLTMEELSGRAKLSDLGDRLAAHPKAKKNPHFRDRIRATAYEHPGQYISCGNGFYALNYAVA